MISTEKKAAAIKSAQTHAKDTGGSSAQVAVLTERIKEITEHLQTNKHDFMQISQVHGQPKRYNGMVYLPLFHPAAALYNGGMRQTLIDDFALIPAIIKKIKSSK